MVIFLEGSYAYHCMTNAAQNDDFFLNSITFTFIF